MSFIPNQFEEVQQNTKFRVSTSSPFTSTGGVAVTPDVVTLTLDAAGMANVIYTWTNGAVPPDPTNTIILDAIGTFHADIDDSVFPPGVLVYWWNGMPGTSHLDTTATKVESTHQSILITS